MLGCFEFASAYFAIAFGVPAIDVVNNLKALLKGHGDAFKDG